jgi:glycosyltransferase involved in cell wall biosynthesis
VSVSSTARRAIAPPARLAAKGVVGLRTRGWAPTSRLFAVGERTGWSVDADADHLEAAARRLGFAVGPSSWARFCGGQAVFLTSHFDALLGPHWLRSTHHLATAYLHGRPGTPGYPEFDRSFERLRADPGRFARVQVTHAEMRDLVLAAGVDESRVHLIPIGIDLEHFALRDTEARTAARRALDIPLEAFVVGSFQKDGVGWGDGLEPKLVKGPDVLVASLERLRDRVPELFVLLTGPARGWVRRELERRSIPYAHLLAGDRSELARAFRALDVYVVASRQEGGPKAVLEAMASGVPLVSTRVGQAQTIVEDGVNGLLVEVDDPGALAETVLPLHGDSRLCEDLVRAGRATAERFSHERLDPAWEALLEGFVARGGI